MTVRMPGHRGSAALELALLVPVLFGVLAFVVLVGRVSGTQAQVRSAAGDGARTGSLWPVGEGAAAVRSSVDASLADATVSCPSPRVEVAWETVAITDAVGAHTVTVEVVCVVPLADLGLPGLPGHRTVAATAVEVVDVRAGS